MLLLSMLIYIKVYICHFKCGCRHQFNLFGYFILFLIAKKIQHEQTNKQTKKTIIRTHAQQEETYIKSPTQLKRF